MKKLTFLLHIVHSLLPNEKAKSQDTIDTLQGHHKGKEVLLLITVPQAQQEGFIFLKLRVRLTVMYPAGKAVREFPQGRV